MNAVIQDKFVKKTDSFKSINALRVTKVADPDGLIMSNSRLRLRMTRILMFFVKLLDTFRTLGTIHQA